jgi:hypothetical protein
MLNFLSGFYSESGCGRVGSTTNHSSGEDSGDNDTNYSTGG